MRSNGTIEMLINQTSPLSSSSMFETVQFLSDTEKGKNKGGEHCRLECVGDAFCFQMKAINNEQSPSERNRALAARLMARLFALSISFLVELMSYLLAASLGWWFTSVHSQNNFLVKQR